MPLEKIGFPKNLNLITSGFEKKWRRIAAAAYQNDYQGFLSCFEDKENLTADIKWFLNETRNKIKNNDGINVDKDLPIFYAFNEKVGNITEEEFDVKYIFTTFKSIGLAASEKEMSDYYREHKYDDNSASVAKKMLDILSDGDSMFRGSSDEYKDIQKSLRLIDEVIKRGGNMASMRFLAVSLRAVVEKAEKYIEKRADVEQNYSLDSYRGKRVHLMRQVCCSLKAELEDYEKEDVITDEDDAKTYYEDLKNVFDNTAASPVIYSELKSCTNVNGKLAFDYFKIGDQTEKVLSVSEDRLETIKNSKTTELLMKNFAGKTVSFDTLLGYVNKIEAFDASVSSEIEEYGKEVLLPSVLLKRMEKTVALEKGEKLNKRVYPDELKTVSITGIKKIDVHICEEQIKRMKKAIRIAERHDEGNDELENFIQKVEEKQKKTGKRDVKKQSLPDSLDFSVVKNGRFNVFGASQLFTQVAKVIRDCSYNQFKAYFASSKDMKDKMTVLVSTLRVNNIRSKAFKACMSATNNNAGFTGSKEFMQYKQSLIKLMSEDLDKKYSKMVDDFSGGKSDKDPVTPQTLLEILNVKDADEEFTAVTKSLENISAKYSGMSEAQKKESYKEILKYANSYVSTRTEIELKESADSSNVKCIRRMREAACAMRERVNAPELKSEISMENVMK